MRGVGEPGIDLAIEPLDDVGGRAARNADAGPGLDLKPRYCLADSRHIRQGRDRDRQTESRAPEPSPP